MASYTVKYAKHATFTATTADTITLTGGAIGFEIVNRDATNLLYFTWTRDGSAPTVAVAAADDTDIVLNANGTKLVMLTQGGAQPIKISAVGNAGAYSVIAIFS